jgi:rubrerythrin
MSLIPASLRSLFVPYAVKYLSNSFVDSKEKLIRILQAAFSGEKAAALAYQGHWKSVKNPAEKEKIQEIEKEEWHHRAIVAEMLQELDARPLAHREFIFGAIGNTLKFLCPISGWFLPMFFAGLLESQNIKEYEQASFYAKDAGLDSLAEQLLQMSMVEREHEAYFFDLVKNCLKPKSLSEVKNKTLESSS